MTRSADGTRELLKGEDEMLKHEGGGGDQKMSALDAGPRSKVREGDVQRKRAQTARRTERKTKTGTSIDHKAARKGGTGCNYY